MVETDVAAELATLRSQLEKLEQQRVERTSPALRASTASSPLFSEPTKKGDIQTEDSWFEGLEDLEPEQILERLKAGASDWFNEFDNELKNAKPSTVLTIFGLGVVIGRLTQ